MESNRIIFSEPTIRTNGQNFAAGQTVRVSGHGWCDAKGVIQQLEIRAYPDTRPDGYRALVQRIGGLKAVWIPLTSLTLL
jgi:hypothetical protein